MSEADRILNHHREMEGWFTEAGSEAERREFITDIRGQSDYHFQRKLANPDRPPTFL